MEKTRFQKNVILIGMPGVGKSTIGVIAAKLLGLRFIDTDLMIQEREDRLLSEIIEEEGIEGFLAIEDSVISQVKARNSVIATGGSACYGRNGMAHLKDLGIVVYLKLGFEPLCDRLGDLKNRGVVLKSGQTLKDLYEERIPLYESYADLTVEEDGLRVEETVEKMVALLKALDH